LKIYGYEFVITNFEILSCVLSWFFCKCIPLFLFYSQKTVKTANFKRSCNDGSGKCGKHTGSEGKGILRAGSRNGFITGGDLMHQMMNYK
jgi:hypothetical protein